MPPVACLPTLADLCRHVHAMLCSRDNLDPELAPLHRTLLTRRNRPCGLLFLVEGPRLLRNYAVWAGEERRIIFYNSGGERIAETRLGEAPDPRSLAA